MCQATEAMRRVCTQEYGSVEQREWHNGQVVAMPITRPTCRIAEHLSIVAFRRDTADCCLLLVMLACCLLPGGGVVVVALTAIAFISFVNSAQRCVTVTRESLF